MNFPVKRGLPGLRLLTCSHLSRALVRKVEFAGAGMGSVVGFVVDIVGWRWLWVG